MKYSLLVILGLSSAFYTVSHGILLNRHYGISDPALDFFFPFFLLFSFFLFKNILFDRKKIFCVCGHVNVWNCPFVMSPQGSVLRPMLFALYMLGLSHFIDNFEGFLIIFMKMILKCTIDYHLQKNEEVHELSIMNDCL